MLPARYRERFCTQLGQRPSRKPRYAIPTRSPAFALAFPAALLRVVLHLHPLQKLQTERKAVERIVAAPKLLGRRVTNAQTRARRSRHRATLLLSGIRVIVLEDSRGWPDVTICVGVSNRGDRKLQRSHGIVRAVSSEN